MSLEWLQSHTVNETNKRIREIADISLKTKDICFSSDALLKIGHSIDNHIYVGRMDGHGIVIASLPMEEAKAAKMGRPLKLNNTFTNTNLHELLGGKDSEWNIVGESPIHSAETYSVWAIEGVQQETEELMVSEQPVNVYKKETSHFE